MNGTHEKRDETPVQKDEIVRGTALDGMVWVIAARTTHLVEELRRRHHTYPVATAALGRAATAGAMMGAMLKGEQKLTVQIKGNGPLGQIVVDANAHGEVRGYVRNAQVDLPLNAKGKLDVAGAIGTTGFLHVIKDLGMKEPYGGSSPLVSGELGEDFTYYFAQSEQTPSAVALGEMINPDASVKAAGGLIVQLLPGLKDEQIGRLEQKLAALPPITAMLDEGAALEEIAERVVGPFAVLGKMQVHFHCNCSRERVEQALASLGQEEVRQMLKQDGQAEVVCHFCHESYRFGPEQLQRIIAKL
ncbi:MAG TPA: Hsp33 family molecular chaperone HslO [Bacilli bacterium]